MGERAFEPNPAREISEDLVAFLRAAGEPFLVTHLDGAILAHSDSFRDHLGHNRTANHVSGLFVSSEPPIAEVLASLKSPGAGQRARLKLEGAFGEKRLVQARLHRLDTAPPLICWQMTAPGAGDVSERLIRRQAERLAVIYAIGRAAVSSAGIGGVFAAALDGLRSLVTFDLGWVYRLHPNENRVTVLASRGLASAGLDPASLVEYPSHAMMESFRRSGCTIVRRSSDASARAQLDALGMESMVGIPLIAQDEVLGALLLASESPGAFTLEAVDDLRHVSAHLSAALLNDILLEEAEQRRQLLERLAGEIASMNAELEGRVATRTRELQRAYDELKDLDQAKTVFLSTVSHELRTPLVTITGYLEMALREQLGPITPRQSRAFTTALRNTNRLDQLINDVLDLTGLEMGKAVFQPVLFDLDRAIEDALAAVAYSVQEKGLTIIRVVDEGLPRVRGEPRRIAQVLTNLLSNAVKFSQSNRRIWIEAHHAGRDSVEIAVRDEAMGIAPEHCARVFESFYQVDGSETRAYGGAGLGLAIVRSILRTIGSEIQLSSEVGVGSRFSFQLGAGHGEPPAKPDGRSPPPIGKTHGKQILVVEDEQEIQEFVKIILEMDGFRVSQAWSGREGLAVARDRHPDLILLDISMAGLSGIEVCRQVKSESETRDIPVYMLSARTSDEDRRASFEAGADGFIRKPFAPEELLETLARVFASGD